MRGRIAVGAWALLAFVSCGSQRTLVLLDVTASVEFNDVHLTVRADQSTVSFAHVHLDAATPYQIGMYLPSDVSGTVTLDAEVDDGVCVRGTGTATATGLAAGNTSAVVPLVVHPLPALSDGCTTPDGGAGGSGGAQGSAGAGGMAAGSAGAGVAGAGTSGAAGATGGAGATGEGGATGVAGTPGIAGMGAGGVAGTAGAGVAGAAGKIGAAGMGGLGVAGAGVAGSSGAAGARGGASGTAGAGGAPTPPIQVAAKCQAATATTTITLHFKILNLSSVTIPLNTITARYFFTLDNPVVPIVEIDYLQSFSRPSMIVTSTTTYVEFGFTVSAGSLRASDNITGSGEIQVRIHPPSYLPTDWNLDQTNDPSFKACTGTTFDPRPGFIGYVNGQQSWPSP